MPINPIASIKQVYQSIPGQTAYNKTTFLGKKALQITPFVAMGYYVRGRVSSGMVINCLDALPVLAKDINTNPQLRALLSSFGIGLEVHRALKAATMCKNTSSPASRFAFFCTTYAAAYYAICYFRSISKWSKPTGLLNPTICLQKRAEYPLKIVALSIQFMYRPYTTMIGLPLGFLFATDIVSDVVVAMKQAIDEEYKKMSESENKRHVEYKKILDDLAEIYKKFRNKPPSTTLFGKIWQEWNRVILAVGASDQALKTSWYRGRELNDLMK